MKILPFVVFAAALVLACDQGASPVVRPLTTFFTLTDTTGATISETRPGQDFILSFNLINTMPDTLTYGWANSGPSIIFRILQNDSAIASSVDGYVFLMIAPRAYLAPGDTLHARWRAPTTPPQNPKVVLAPGTYQATVGLPYLYGVNVDPIQPITFMVAF